RSTRRAASSRQSSMPIPIRSWARRSWESKVAKSQRNSRSRCSVESAALRCATRSSLTQLWLNRSTTCSALLSPSRLSPQTPRKELRRLVSQRLLRRSVAPHSTQTAPKSASAVTESIVRATILEQPLVAFGPEVVADLQAGLRREWLVTNGLGGYASSTVVGINTRRYHGLL